jgi:hypothetical protein
MRRFNTGPSCRRPSSSKQDDGYAAVDALVALMILAATLVCSVSATHGSRLAADAALELRRANELGVYLVETAPVSPGKTSGQAQGFAWTLEVMDPVNAFGPGAICERRVVLTGLRDQRQFSIRANAVCPAAKPA